MKIVILTSSVTGVAAHAVPLLFAETDIKIKMVVFNEGHVANKRKHYLKKFQKVFKIGLFGAINGIRMRNWFGKNAERLLPPAHLEMFCRNNNIPFKKTPAINCDITRELFKNAEADVGISLGNSYISRSVFSLCRLGMINIHGEVLPEYQNAQSVIWQIYNGSSETGFTIHKINSKIDQGDILYTEKFPIIFRKNLKETIAYTCAEITLKACAGLVKVIKEFYFYNQHAIQQGKGNHYTTPNRKEFNQIKKQFRLLKSKAAVN